MGLSIYSASAGSGKTYTITRAYLRWALSSSWPDIFESLLAITFTNKAAEEMKSRILDALNKVAENNDEILTLWLCKELNLSPEELRKRAIALRTAILHDYSHFAVSTIDKFFQKLIRSFMHETGLSPEFAIELDAGRILDESIERLLQNAGHDTQLKEWLCTIIEKRIENGQHWDVRQSLKEMGKEIFKESFRRFGSAFQEKLKDKKFLANYAGELQNIVNEFERYMLQQSSDALLLLEKNRLTVSDFKFKNSGFANYFNKIKQKDCVPTPRVLDALDNIEKWYGSDTSKHTQIEHVYEALNRCLNLAVLHYNENFIRYNTARQVLQHIYSMGLLADMANNAAQIAAEENIMEIGESLQLLFNLIGDNDAPFIYEKAGAHFHSFLLDEFQDTSDMQWNSLKPLLKNGLAEGGNLIVVGDVKQSIYRWRNGDWRILANRLAEAFRSFDVSHITLDENWRSAKTLVEANNMLFVKLSQLLRQRVSAVLEETGGITVDDIPLSTAVSDAYKDVVQRTASKNSHTVGYMQIEVLNNEDGIPAKEKSLQQLPDLITDLQHRGYRLSDVAVLVRENTEGQLVADTLIQHGIPVISQESLFLVRSPAVHFITELLYRAVYPDDTISKTCIEKYLHTLDSAFISGYENWLSVLARQPLMEAFESIIQHFELYKLTGELAFIQELHDIIFHYATNETNDIYSFVAWWAEKGKKQTLTIPAKQEAVRILTIHKSKGLQFKVTLIPFCSWPLEPKTNTMFWVNCREAPFNKLPWIPLSYKKTLADTCFYDSYIMEKIQSYIDNLNLLYVAFTRAEEELHVFASNPGNNKYSVGQLLHEALQTTRFTTGDKLTKTPAPATQEQDTQSLHDYPSYPYRNRLRLKYAGEAGETHNAGMRDYGILMHRAFAEINTLHDIETALTLLVAQGYMPDNATQINILRQKIREAIAEPGAAVWFDGSWKLLTEAGILLPNTGGMPHQLRPDRVMIGHGKVVVVDYKFGEHEHDNHGQQVGQYMDCLRRMGYAAVEGYLWYVSKKKIIPVFRV